MTIHMMGGLNMQTWISDNYEKNIKLWYQQVKEGKQILFA